MVLLDLGKKLIEQMTLALIVIGLSLFLLGLNGGWKRFDIDLHTPATRLATIVMGLIVCGGGAWLLYWREKADSRKKTDTGQFDNSILQATNLMKIDGEYHTETHHYRIFIIPLARNSYRKGNPDLDYYRIYHDDWEGAGFFDNECFYTVFQLNDKATQPDRRGNWGGHIARWRPKTKSFEVFGFEMKGKDHYAPLEGEWTWERDLN